METLLHALRSRVCVCILEPRLGMENVGLTCFGEVKCVVTQGPEEPKVSLPRSHACFCKQKPGVSLTIQLIEAFCEIIYNAA